MARHKHQQVSEYYHECEGIAEHAWQRGMPSQAQVYSQLMMLAYLVDEVMEVAEGVQDCREAVNQLSAQLYRASVS